MVHKGNYKAPFFLLYFLALSLFFLPFSALAAEAELSLTPQGGSFTVGKEFSLNVSVDPKGTKVNVADGLVSFDNQYLSVISLSKSGSAFSLWTAEPEFSNSNGTISFAGGSPSGFSSKSNVLTVRFKALKAGNTSISFKSGSILAADGKGTDVFSGGITSSYTLEESKEVAPPKPKEQPKTTSFIPQIDVPEAPKITSKTHEDPEKWYNKKELELSWDVSYEITSERYAFSKDKEAALKTVETPPLALYKSEELEDGEWYFKLQLQNVAGWGEIASRKVLIDMTEPLEFDIQVVVEGLHVESPKLYFEAEDELSGIASYEVVIGDGPTTNVLPENLIDGFYKIPPQDGGFLIVAVKAFDKAGNFREVKKEMDVPFIAAPVKVEEIQEEDSFITAELIFAIFFAFVAGAVTAFNIYQRKKFKKERDALLQEASELREKTDKIFSAIGEELEEQVNALDKKPQLTPEERDFIEKMREVLDISEEILDTDIEELRKMTKKQ